MDLSLTEEQRMFAESVRGFAERHLAAGALQRAQADSFPWDVAKLMAEAGLLGITIPEANGGQGGSLMDAVLAIEQVSLVCPRSGDVIQAGNFGPIRTFAEYATADQRERYLRPILAGERLIALGMTEPEAGSAVTDLKTMAKPDGDGYRISGSKCFTTNSGEAGVFLVYVRFGPGGRRHRLGAGRARHAGLRARQIDQVHERRDLAARSISTIAISSRATCCSGPAASRSRSPGSTPSASATRRARWRSAGSASTWRASMPARVVSSAAHCANSRACNGSSPTCRSSSTPASCCSTAPRSAPTGALPSPQDTAVAKLFCKPGRLRHRLRGTADPRRHRLLGRLPWSNIASARRAPG